MPPEIMVCLIMKDLMRGIPFATHPVISFFAIAVFMTTFWPLTHGMNYFTNRHAVFIWLTVGWALAITTRKTASLPAPSNNA